MQEFDHPNILKLVGVCLDGGPAPYVIMPFMTNGSLLSHVKENRGSFVIDPTSAELGDGVRSSIYTVRTSQSTCKASQSL